MSDYFEVRELVNEIVAQGGNYLSARRYKDAVKVLNEILNYPQEYVDMEKYRETYELLVKIIRESKGSVALDVLPLIIAGRLLEDPLIDMNIGIAVTELEQTQAAADPNLFQNCRDRIIEWLIDNTEEFARVHLADLARDLNVPLDLLERIINDAIFDGYIVGKLDTEKKDLIVMPYEQEKRQLKCIICYQDIDFDAPDLVRCRYCGTVAHHEHIMQWVAAAGKKCPRCMSELELD
ncbi:MAG: PCI domain-containing protein [Candidatus Helarchaeota archaeon]|nr:PCI domain-containing protein [Candidatus Helarchaeota archaeon]